MKTSPRMFPPPAITCFLETAVPPPELTCGIGLGLLRHAARIHGDTTNQRYEADTIKRALEANPRNPLTRARVEAQPALLADPQRQKEVLIFRAQVLGYTKVAAFCAEHGRSMPNGAALLLPPRLTPRQAVAAQTVLNSLVRSAARKAVPQPRASIADFARVEQEVGWGLNVLELSTRAAQRAGLVVLDIGSAAEEAALAALEAQDAARAASDLNRSPALEAHARASYNADDFELVFGPDVARAGRNAVREPSFFNATSLMLAARRQDVALEDVLTFDHGRIIRSFLHDRAWTPMIAMMPTLVHGFGRIAVGGSPGIRWLDPDHTMLYAGEMAQGAPHGVGVAWSRTGAGYAAGRWAIGTQNGPGIRHNSATGVIETGVFFANELNRGVRENNGVQLRGRFNGRLSGLGERMDASGLTRGLWQNGRAVRGEAVLHEDGRHVLFAPGPGPGVTSIGIIRFADASLYRGGIHPEVYERHGFGILSSPNGQFTAATWINDQAAHPTVTGDAMGHTLSLQQEQAADTTSAEPQGLRAEGEGTDDDEGVQLMILGLAEADMSTPEE